MPLTVNFQDTLSSALASKFCTHCGSEIKKQLHSNLIEDSAVFCCFGCKSVFHFMKSNGFLDYYRLKDHTVDAGTPLSPAGLNSQDYRYLDDPAFKEKYATQSVNPCMNFYVEGVHCAACVWLVEKLPEIVSGVQEAKLDLGRAVASITLKNGGTFSEVAQKLEWFGYKPHPIESDENALEFLRAENRDWLKRIGVAAACSGNIMLLAVSVYAGLQGKLALYFSWLSFALFCPVLFYSAAPFYKTALSSIRSKSLSIDVPIVLAIVLGSAVSLFNLVKGSQHIYLDSISALIFLLLSSRYALRRIQQRNFGGSHLYHFLSPSVAKRLDIKAASFVKVNVSALLPGDLIEVAPGETVPVDGVVEFGSSVVNCSFLTGESVPQPVHPGSEIFSGTINESAAIQIKVLQSGKQTRLAKILNEVEQGVRNKAPIVIAADRISKGFLAAVLLSAIAVFVFSASFEDGVNRALALVIVTCPCALALATPLSMTLSLQKAAKVGILINGSESLEKINRIKEIILDKTGTITYGKFEILEWNVLTSEQVQRLAENVIALEETSQHPVARALVQYLKPKVQQPIPEVKEFYEEIGVGVSGIIHGQKFQIRALKEADRNYQKQAGTAVGVYRNEILIATAILGDKIRSDASESIQNLKRAGLTSYILSGDSINVVNDVARRLKILSSNTVAHASPEQKRDFVQSHALSLMIGDGANDALALSTAYVSAAVHGSMEVSLRAADVYIAKPGLKSIVKLVHIAHETMKVIYRNFAFSLFYNLIGGIAALTGHITPFFAALLMPISAFTVFSSSLWGTEKLRKIFNVRTAA